MVLMQADWTEKEWFVIHGVSGFILSKLGLDLWQTLAVLIAWEIIERRLADTKGGVFVETRQNRWQDVAVGVAGYALGLPI